MFPFKDNIPTDRTPVVTIALIVANVLMYFLFQQGTILGGPDDANVVLYGAIPFELTNFSQGCVSITGDGLTTGGCAGQPPTWLTVLTSMFMHGSVLHLAGNMLFLWVFANNVEDSMGRGRFLAFYLLGGLAATALQTAVGPGSVVPTIGASGAVSAVLGGYILLFPRARVWTLLFIVVFFTVLNLPAIAVLGLWFAQQLAFAAFDVVNPTGAEGGVAYFAHIGGFLFGLAAIRIFAQRAKRPARRLPVY
ncbi:MAG TPA: rhomboid family intramembrane serine protease [Solirubrobacteraceae bacterium]|nr:rhomboid family intramembrane serine protease [Solirubrobacteraceae bacterium]